MTREIVGDWVAAEERTRSPDLREVIRAYIVGWRQRWIVGVREVWLFDIGLRRRYPLRHRRSKRGVCVAVGESERNELVDGVCGRLQSGKVALLICLSTRLLNS